MSIDIVKFQSVASDAKRALENVDKKNKLTGADEFSINQLGTEVITLAKQVIAKAGRDTEVGKYDKEGKVTDGSIRRDSSLPDLAKRTWLNTDGISLALGRGVIDKELDAFVDLLLDTNGAWEIKANCDEITGRDKRKTVDGLAPGDDFKVGVRPIDQEILNGINDLKRNFGIK